MRMRLHANVINLLLNNCYTFIVRSRRVSGALSHNGLGRTLVDLSDRVFSAGMAYVALSRVRSLAGLHLSAFHHKSIIVSTSCLKEVNRLRGIFRKDLPQYQLPKQTATTCRKRKLTGSNSGNLQKILRVAQTTSDSLLKKPARQRKRPKNTQCDDDRSKKKLRVCVVATNTTQRRIRT